MINTTYRPLAELRERHREIKRMELKRGTTKRSPPNELNSNEKLTMKPKMTLNDHLETADDLAIASHHLDRVYFRCYDHSHESGELMKLLLKFVHNDIRGDFSELKHQLDDSYHELISGEQFREHGHIYYNLEARYEELSTKKPDWLKL